MTNSKEYWKKYYHGRPWAKTLRYIYKRCAPSGLYWKKGIKNFLSMNDIEYLWVRDNAHLLKEPSIDRKNPKGNYTVDNCQYIEFRENRRKDLLGKPRKKEVLQKAWATRRRKVETIANELFGNEL
jgi:hypothetical protein